MDLTALWVWWQRHKNSAGLLIVGLVLFGTGWQLGRVMAPYYAAHPIVFEDNRETSGASAGGSREELLALRDAGTTQSALAEAGSVATPTTSPATTPTAVVAGTVSTAAPTAGKLFVGSINSDKYHHKDCPSARQIKEENQVWFGSVEEAERAGYVPSKCTQDKLK